MQRSPRILILVTLLCYLAASSIASAHGFSSLNQKPSNLVASAITMMAESKDMECHSSQVLLGEKSSSSTCKIFCSVMAQAMTEDNISISVSAEPLAVAPSSRVLVLSRQLAVEKHPPK